MAGRIVRKTNNLEKFIKRIQKLTESNVESGYFIEQGNHPEADIPYTELMYMHHTGQGNLPRRDILNPTLFELPHSGFIQQAHKGIAKYLYHGKPLEPILDDFGEDITRLAVSFFGVPSAENPSNSPVWAEMKGGDTPMLFEGHLRDAWAYRTSEDNLIKANKGRLG